MIIYEAYNKLNGKSYIGLTAQPLEVRKGQHLRSAKAGSMAHFHKAIRKYGEEAFEWHESVRCQTLGDLYKVEQVLIKAYGLEDLYNKSLGGEHSAYGMKHTEKTKEICGEASKRRWDGKRVIEVTPLETFELPFREAKKLGISKTSYYRAKRSLKELKT